MFAAFLGFLLLIDIRPVAASGDFDGNGVVDLADFFMFADHFGSESEPKFDLNGDGSVGFGDFFLLSDAFPAAQDLGSSVLEIPAEVRKSARDLGLRVVQVGAGERIVKGTLNLGSRELLDRLAQIGGPSFTFAGRLRVEYTQRGSFEGLEGLRAVEELDIRNSRTLLSLSGLENVRVILGTLRIEGNDSLNVIEGLKGLRQIGEDLIIVDNPFLTEVDFPDLEAIEENLVLGDNPLWKDMGGLNKLRRVGGNVELRAIVEGLNAFNNIEEIGGDFVLLEGSFLNNISGFNGLNRIGGDIVIGAYSFQGITGLSQLEVIDGNIVLQDGSQIIDLQLNGLYRLGGSLYVGGDPEYPVGSYNYSSRVNKFSAFSGLDNLEVIEGDLYFDSNFNLKSVNSLGNLKTVKGNVWIRGNSKLTDLAIISSLDRVGGTIRIDNNASLQSLKGIEGLVEVGGDVIVTQNPNLKNVEALGRIANRVRSIDIAENQSLEHIDGWEDLTEIQGSLFLRSNHNLKSLRGLSNIRRVGGALFIRFCSSLEDMTGLQNLRSIGGTLRIWNNDRLENLAALKNLRSVGGRCIIESNRSLASMNGLRNLLHVHEEAIIADNELLPSSHVQTWTDRLRANGLDRIKVEDNKPGKAMTDFLPPDVDPADSPVPTMELIVIEGDFEPFFPFLVHHATPFPCVELKCEKVFLDFIEHATGGRPFKILGNLKVLGASFSMGNLIHVTGNLELQGNPDEYGCCSGGTLHAINLETIGGDFIVNSLSSMGSMGDLARVGGDFKMINPFRITALPSLSRIEGSVEITATSLEDLRHLDALTFIGGNIAITNNENLPQDLAIAFVEKLRNQGFAGEVTLAGNKETSGRP